MRPPSVQIRKLANAVAPGRGTPSVPLSAYASPVLAFAPAADSAPRPSSRAIRLGRRSHPLRENGRDIEISPGNVSHGNGGFFVSLRPAKCLDLITPASAGNRKARNGRKRQIRTRARPRQLLAAGISPYS